MAENKGHDHSTCSCAATSSSVQQTLDEMEWERGIWYAGKCIYIYICIFN